MGRPEAGAGERSKAMIVALCMVVPLLAMASSSTVQASSTERVFTITESEAQPTESWDKFDGNPLKLYDFDKDGDLEIVAQNDNGWVYIFDSKNENMLAEIDNQPNIGARPLNGPEAAILDDGDGVKLILADAGARLSSWRFDPGSSSSSDFVLHKEWERSLTDCDGDKGMDSKPVFADLDGDGDLEILAMTEDTGLYALHDDGSVMWKQCDVNGNASPAVGDLNQDGTIDVVAVTDGGTVAAFHGWGGWMWADNVKNHATLGSGSIPVQAGIGQLDGKGGPDVVVGARDSHDTEDYDNNHAALMAFSSSGGLLWKFQDFEKGNPLTYTRPVVVDTGGDGTNEVYWGDWNTIGHKGGIPDEDAWSTTGPANFYRIDHQGHQVWRTTLDTWWSNKDVPLADVDGDGVQEMLANGPSGGKDGIWYLNSVHGAQEDWVSVDPWKVMRAPVIGDLWGSGSMQWVIEVSSHSEDTGAIIVYDTHQPYDSAWPHPPGPGDATGSGGDGGSDSGDFDASYSGVKGNEWWIQTQVSTSGGTLSHVDVRLDGGEWKPLEDEGWGWAESYHAPEGTIVQFRATSTGGATDHSGCYRWTDATKTECSGGGGGSFSASFDPRAQGNDWWVETAVSANEPVVRVQAEVNGGSWTDLDKTDWGTWAKSIHAPDGSEVRFRAHSDSGETATSQTYIWD